MSISTPIPVPASAAAGNVPDPVLRRSTFNSDAQAFFYWIAGQTGVGDANFVALITNAYQNAGIAYQNAIAAAANAAANGATLWDINKNNYAVGEIVISPAALAAGAANVVYVCKLATSGVHIDPYNDPARWSVFSIFGATGGAVYTTSTTLAASSPFAISISGRAGVWLKLPDATTLQAGAKYHVCNSGENDVRVLNSAGAVLGFIRPRENSNISLADSGTAAGTWVHGLAEFGITQKWQALSTTTGVNNIKAAVRIDSDRVMFVVGGQSGGQLHAVVWSDTAGIGATYIIRAAAYYANAVLCGTGQVMVISADNSTAMQGVVLTATGTTIAAGAVGTSTLSSSCTAIGQLIATPTGYALAFNMGANGCVRGVAISGGSPVFGSENILPVYSIGGVNDIPRLYLSGSVVRTVRYTGSAIESKPFTSSGATLTSGTLAAMATAINAQYKTALMQNGNLAVLHFNGGKFVLSIFKLTSTTEAVYSQNVSATVTPPTKREHYDMQVFGSKVVTFCFSYTASSPYSALSVAVVTDNSGSSSVGAIYQRILSANDLSGSLYLSYIPSTNTNEYGINIKQSTITSIPVNYNLFFDCSGTSPVISKNKNIGALIPTVAANLMPRDDFCMANAATCSNNSGVYCFNPSIVFGGNSATLQYAQKYNAADGLKSISASSALQIIPTVRGENEQCAYSVDYHGNENGTNYGITVTRIEVCSN